MLTYHKKGIAGFNSFFRKTALTAAPGTATSCVGMLPARFVGWIILQRAALLRGLCFYQQKKPAKQADLLCRFLKKVQ